MAFSVTRPFPMCRPSTAPWRPRTVRLTLLALSLAALPSHATDAMEASRETESSVRASWYADGSCLMRIEQHELVGITGIDADMGPDGARTMVHCDADTGQRMTVMTRGDGLAIGERVVLEDPADIETSVNGSVAWIALLDDAVAPENTPRRFIVNGRIMIRETPDVEVAGYPANADKLPFAEIVGRLEPLKRHPDPQEPGATAETVDPEGVTRMACRVRPCAPAKALVGLPEPVAPAAAPAAGTPPVPAVMEPDRSTSPTSP